MPCNLVVPFLDIFSRENPLAHKLFEDRTLIIFYLFIFCSMTYPTCLEQCMALIRCAESDTYSLNWIILTWVLQMGMCEGVHCSMVFRSKEAFTEFRMKRKQKQNGIITFIQGNIAVGSRKQTIIWLDQYGVKSQHQNKIKAMYQIKVKNKHTWKRTLFWRKHTF